MAVTRQNNANINEIIARAYGSSTEIGKALTGSAVVWRWAGKEPEATKAISDPEFVRLALRLGGREANNMLLIAEAMLRNGMGLREFIATPAAQSIVARDVLDEYRDMIRS